MFLDQNYSTQDAKEMLLHTLDSMCKGGLYDLVDGGFCRYSVDKKWKVPHFEKMLYDNALLCELYTNAYINYKDTHHLNIAKETANFILDELSEDELFFSATDADSKEGEGWYFTYTYDEIYDALKINGFKNIQTKLYDIGVSPFGNFKDRNIIRFETTQEPIFFKEIKPILKAIRSKREYPFIDKKIQTSWSSMMIKALFTLSEVDDSYKDKAINSLQKLLKTLYIDSKLYHSTLFGKKPKVEAFLEDYAYLTSAIIKAYEITKDTNHIIFAQRFTNLALERFYKNGIWNFSDNDFVTKADISDNTYTSSVAIMVDNLLKISKILNDDKYKHFAFKTLEYNSYNLARQPVYYPYMLVSMLKYLK